MTDPRTVHEHLSMYRRFLSDEPDASHLNYEVQERVLAPLTNRPPRALQLASPGIPVEWNNALDEFLDKQDLKGVVSVGMVPVLVGKRVLVPVNGAEPIKTTFNCVGAGYWNGPAVVSESGSVHRVPTMRRLDAKGQEWRERNYGEWFEQAGMFGLSFIGLTTNQGYDLGRHTELSDEVMGQARMNPGWHLDAQLVLPGRQSKEKFTVDLETRMFQYKNQAPVVEKTEHYARLVQRAKES